MGDISTVIHWVARYSSSRLRGISPGRFRSDLPFLKKRFKEKSFAKGASREQMAGCAKLGMELDEFLSLCLAAMQKTAVELEL